ncbi:J domain-containing protein [Paeniglutamicibacter sp. ABSL32-1]|uniref:J domain-containing protein n=1 Tax=Paeniglutamicibacter quisquiliarum TaxID=2849498 RepID=UPI001C2DD70F|nr:J domain-containing protein [Paeniglutamicibacter quisquiliarum]
MESRNPYAVLRLDPQASAAEISRAYRAQMRLHHPDTRPGPDGPEQEALERSRLQSVMDAYAVLGNAAARSDYDREHPAARRTAGPAGARRVSRTTRPEVVAGPLVWTLPPERRKP